MGKHLIAGVFAITSLVTQIPSHTTIVPVQDIKPTNEQVVIALVDKYSKEYGVSKDAMLHTLENEDKGFDFTMQSHCLYKAGNKWGFTAGTQEKSYGVAQIHLPDHPQITLEQAYDPDFSIKFIAIEFSKGNQKQWMGYAE